MKKILLMLVALVATVTISAKDGEEMEGWQKSFTPVANADDLAGIHTAVAGDGSVYASTTYSQTFSFAGKPVTDPEGLLSSCVVKYDKDGNEKWAVSLVGKCKIYAMTADTDGTLYVAGSSSDEKIVVTGVDGKTTEILNPTKEDWGEIVVAGQAAFLLKISVAGAVENSLKIEAVGPETGYYGEAYVRPRKIVVDNDKIFVSCFYQGAVSSLGWEGRYVTMLDFDTFETSYFGDITGAGLFSVDKAFAGLTSIANVQATTDADLLDDGLQCGPDAFDFVVYGGVPHVAFIGWGNETLNTAAGSQAFTFEMAGESNNEHAMVLVNVNAPQQPKVFHAAPHDKVAAPYNLVGAALSGDNCILGGTFYGNFALDNTVTKDKNTSFVASIKMSDCSVNWTTVSPVEAEASCMVVAGEEIKASTNAATYTIKTATGEVDTEQTMAQSFDDADCYNNQYVSTIFTQETSVVVFSPKLKPSGINNTQATKNTVQKYYNLNGIELTAPQNGLNIVKTADGTRKVLK